MSERYERAGASAENRIDPDLRSNGERMMDSAQMASGGTDAANYPDYKEEHDVRDSIAEGYY